MWHEIFSSVSAQKMHLKSRPSNLQICWRHIGKQKQCIFFKMRYFTVLMYYIKDYINLAEMRNSVLMLIFRSAALAEKILIACIRGL
jgi:hypothetical protein